jgi:hypothetical protein
MSRILVTERDAKADTGSQELPIGYMRPMATHHHDSSGSRSGLTLLGVVVALAFLWVVARLALAAFG